MRTLKLSYIWMPRIDASVIFLLIQKLSKQKIEFVTPDKADLLFIGPYDLDSFRRKFYNFLKRKIKYFINLENYLSNLDIYLLSRANKTIRVFYNNETYLHNFFKADYFISSFLGIADKNHLRFPHWKDHIDWTHEGIYRESKLGNALRFGSFYKIESLMEPQGDDFLKKKREMCIFTSHLNEPRKFIYNNFLKEFKIDGYGPYFDKNINNHNLSPYKKIDIMKNYSFNLCPENTMYPGSYTEKIPDAFLGKCLPISWADNNVGVDFNCKAFVNLNDYMSSNFEELFKFLKDDNYLKNFAKEPLLFQKPNLDSEINFIETVLSNI
jgi:hypothetical protein